MLKDLRCQSCLGWLSNTPEQDPPEVSISGYDGNWYLGQPEASLTCDARSNPEPTGYEWST
ncbi:hypothetical protein P7K49_034546 [Saguinus oedipus]|uniref:Ig-like domain-containing protein n=1 Tax=Saguinus oedipus TaxID=9490 RepID=A0ABQ9TV21_SAGOE|nr:hypothetical protein P7K49_034546 [Saguinus oedipus]